MDRAEICKSLLTTGQRILDVGGWQGDIFQYGTTPNAVLDIFPPKNNKVVEEWITGDACRKETWKDIEPKSFDFSICSQILEDCYDPFVIMNELSRVSKEGYIETPRIWMEGTRFQVYKNRNIRGYAHHIWMVDVFPCEFLDSQFVITPISKRPGEIFPRNKSGKVLCFYPKMIFSHHEILHKDFINPLRAFYLRKKHGHRLDTVALHWKGEIPYACIWWGSSHLESLKWIKNYYDNFDYTDIPEYYLADESK
jgi:hypothetical protein